MPARDLLFVRHGESTGNVAAAAADAAGADAIDIDLRDADVPLSELGRRQAEAVGHALVTRYDHDGRSAETVVWSSPYRRARETAMLALDSAGLTLDVRIDDRLRDRELGILDRLTARGVHNRFPDEAARRRFLGKLYYRPPGGESWTDVALRLRSTLRELDDIPATRAVVFCHDAVITLACYVLEGLDEDGLMELVAHPSPANGSITHIARPAVGAAWATVEHNDVEHLHELGTPPTRHEGERDVAPR